MFPPWMQRSVLRFVFARQSVFAAFPTARPWIAFDNIHNPLSAMSITSVRIVCDRHINCAARIECGWRWTMSFRQTILPDSKTSDAATALGHFIREEYGRNGVRMYLSFLQEMFPSEWSKSIADALESPMPVPSAPPRQSETPPMPPIPPPDPPRGSGKPDMEKMLRLVQLMSNLKT